MICDMSLYFFAMYVVGAIMVDIVILLVCTIVFVFFKPYMYIIQLMVLWVLLK